MPGSTFVDISPTALEPGASTLNFTLVFSNPKLEAIHYTPHILGTRAPSSYADGGSLNTVALEYSFSFPVQGERR